MLSRVALRSGVTLVEVVVSVAILAVFATAVIVSAERSAATAGNAKRAENAAEMLERLRDAAVRYNYGDPATGGLSGRTIVGDTSFTSKISGLVNLRGGVNPSRLSQLTNKIASTDLNSCGGQFGATNAGNWKENFFNVPIAIGGTIKLADGFIANDALERYDPTGTTLTNLSPNTLTTGAGLLAIVIPNVALGDAQALAQQMEGDQPATLGSGNFAVVRFTPSGNAPVTVRFFMAIHGC